MRGPPPPTPQDRSDRRGEIIYNWENLIGPDLVNPPPNYKRALAYIYSLAYNFCLLIFGTPPVSPQKDGFA